MAENNYDPQSVYDSFADVVIPGTCGCGQIGLVAIKNCSGEILGYLTPYDASLYNIDTIEVPVGYVKYFHPTTGAYLGILTIAQAMEYTTYLTQGA